MLPMSTNTMRELPKLTSASESVGPGVEASVLHTLMTEQIRKETRQQVFTGVERASILPRKRVRLSFGMTAARNAPAEFGVISAANVKEAETGRTSDARVH